MKKIIAFILALVCCLSMGACSDTGKQAGDSTGSGHNEQGNGTQPEDHVTERVDFSGITTADEDFVYKIVTLGTIEYVQIVDYIGTSGIAVVPETIEGIRVGSVTLDGTREEKRTNLIALKVPQCVTAVSVQYCSSLTTVELPDSITTQQAVYDFRNCSALTYINIPNGITTIGGIYATVHLTGCSSITSITLPDTVVQIVDDAFRYCRGLESINIPSSVERIGQFAFQYCSSLTEIEIPGSCVIAGMAFTNCSSLRSVCFPAGEYRIGGDAFSYCHKDLVFKCLKGSAAETYAVDNEIPVEYIEG